jgi:PQQ-dependent dehydrogenase (methanol/ethanol family)
MRGLGTAALAACALALGLGLAGCHRASGPAAVDQARLVKAASEPANWMSYGGTWQEQRFSPLDRINDGNVSGLKLAWFQELDTNRGQEATPLVVDGVMYVSTAWSKVLAFDAATGRRLWSYDPKVPGGANAHACCDAVNRGVAVWKGKVFVGALDGRLIALDARTGQPVWTADTVVDHSMPYTVTGAPRVFKDKVVIGNSGAELGVRGYISAYDTQTGKLVWRFFTVPGDPSKGPDHAPSDGPLAKIAAPTWSPGEAGWKYGGGGTVWDAITYDPDTDLLFFGTDNGDPWSQDVRSPQGGDNLFTTSIVAVKPDTGEYVWHYQLNPGEEWDFSATQQLMLADLKIGGTPRKVIMQAAKNGFFYVLDRTSGKLISVGAYAPMNWATGFDMKTGRPIEDPSARLSAKARMVYPSGIGAHAWQPMSYSPRTGLIYIPAMQVPLVYSSNEQFEFHKGRWNTGVNLLGATLDTPGVPPGTRSVEELNQGWLSAWDPVAQKEVWRVPYAHPWNGGTLATGGNLVFQGDALGGFHAYRADTGKALWSFDAQDGVMGGPMTFEAGGRQYVAVMSGYGGSMGTATPPPGQDQVYPNGRLLVFALDGKAALPPFTPTPRPPPNPPAETFPAAMVAAGAKSYGTYCRICHAGAINPDLRRSAALADKALWKSIVIDGRLEPMGMASFRGYLTADQAEEVRAYVAGEAVKLKEQTETR